MNNQISIQFSDTARLIESTILNADYVETHKWQEFHENGQLWIDGEIAVISESKKHLYDFRTGFKGFERKPVCRIGIWSKYFDNGQIGWSIDYGDGSYEVLFSSKRKSNGFPSFRKDGTGIVNY